MREVVIRGVEKADPIRRIGIRLVPNFPANIVDRHARGVHQLDTCRLLKWHWEIRREFKSSALIAYRHWKRFDDIFLSGIAEHRTCAEKQPDRYIHRGLVAIVPSNPQP